MSLSLAEHHGRWTVHDLRRMPEDEFNRYEIDDGVLIVGPRPSSPHQVASRRIANLLEDAIVAADVDYEVVQEVDTIASERDDWLKIPDVVVVTADAFAAEPQEYVAADIVLAVEVSGSRQSRNRDFVEKRDAYATEGIERYWIVELQPKPKLTAFRLRDGSYEEVAVSQDLIRVAQPFPVEVDPPALVRGRRL